MQFHDYDHCRPKDWRGSTLDWLKAKMISPAVTAAERVNSIRYGVEVSWLTHERPFFNVHPIAVELCLKTSLNMTWGDILFPVRTLLLRFAPGHEPLGITTALLRVPSDAAWTTHGYWCKSRRNGLATLLASELGGVIHAKDEKPQVWMYWRDGGQSIKTEVIKDSIGTKLLHCSRGEKPDGRGNFLIRLLAFMGLLAKGTDLITPAILAKDRAEYDDPNTSAARKEWLETRARKRLGVGYDVGRKLEIERSTSPHWRCPHLALFHTGKGRTKPVLRIRSGCVVMPRDMSEVPTGFLGKETPEELAKPKDRPLIYREPIPKRLRFLVLRRDKYTCQICGRTQKDGVKLEVDHKLAVARGGKTEKANLWTLCHPCNNGKSDLLLHEAS